MLALAHPMTQCHIQDVILQQTCCENQLQLVHIFTIGNNCNFSGSLNFTTTPWCRQFVAGLPMWRPRFNPRPVHMGSVVYNVTMGQVFCFIQSLSFQRCLVLVHSPTTDVITLETGSNVKQHIHAPCCTISAYKRTLTC